MESNSTSLDFFESPGQLWHMYKNAKNLIAHKARIENLTWRMMYVKDQELLRNKFKIGNNHDIFPSVPLEQLNIFGSTMFTSEETQKEEEFEYIAHVRTMSNSQQTRKRPAPLSPFLAAIHEPELPDPVSIRSNLSAALKINPSQTSSANNNDNGYEFLLDPLAFEGPNQNFSDVRENPVEYTGQIDNFGSRSIQGPTSTFATRPTFSHSSSSNQQDFFTENPPIQSIQESSPFQKILDPQLSNMDPMEFHRNMNSSGIASSAPQTISMVQNQSRFPPSKRQTPSSSYDPVSFGYNPGSAFANGASISRSRNSLVNVADHFAPPSRPFTPYDDDTGYISDTMNLGNYQSDHNVLLSAKSSLVDLSFMGETDSEMTFFDTKARGPPVSLLSQQLNHQQSTSMQNPTTNTGISWTDLDDSGSPGGLVLTANPGTTTNMIRLNSLSKKKNKHVKGKKKTDFSSFSGPTGKKAVQERKANAVGSRGGAKVNGKGGGANANGNPTIECTNCYTKTTPLWRRNPQGEPLCNACGLFLKLHGTVRPLSLKTDVIKKRQRGQGPNALNKPSQPQKTNTKGSSQVPVIKPNRDGDDFNPRPINKTGTKEMSDSTRTNDTNLNEEKGEGVVSINSQDTLLPPNGLEKENEWYTMPPNDLSMDTEIHEKSKESWDWLSMNI